MIEPSCSFGGSKPSWQDTARTRSGRNIAARMAKDRLYFFTIIKPLILIEYTTFLIFHTSILPHLRTVLKRTTWRIGSLHGVKGDREMYPSDD
jgi:hypothetical protein